MIKKQIPNSLTALNLVSGIFAILATFENQLLWAGFFIGVGAIFDFFDGMAARALHVKSDMGKEMDSLADLVSFGLAPGFIVFQLMIQSVNLPQVMVFDHNIAPFAAFLLPVFSAFRLAKFNIDPRQTSSFIGLPTPASALFFVSLVFISQNVFAVQVSGIQQILQNYWVLAGLSLLISILMVSELPLFSLKFSSLKWKENQTRFIFIVVSLILGFLLKMTAIPMIIFWYIALSVYEKLKV